MRINRVEPPVIFDTDLMQCFASIDNGIDILAKTLGKEIYVTGQVLEETRLLYAWFKKQDIARRIDVAVSKGVIGRMDVFAVEEDARLFTAMISGNCPGLPAIGKGEAAALVLAKISCGTIASNNLRDVKKYCVNNGIPLLCTEDVLSLAVISKPITLDFASQFWDKLKKDGHFLPSYDFPTAYQRFCQGRISPIRRKSDDTD